MSRYYNAKFKVTLEIGPLFEKDNKKVVDKNEFVIKAKSKSQVYDLLNYLWFDGNPESFVDTQKLLEAREEALEEDENETFNWEFDTVSVEKIKKTCDYDYDAGDFEEEIEAYNNEWSDNGEE